MDSDAQLVSSEFPIGVQMGSDQETYLTFLNTLSPVLSTPLSYVCCVCMDRLMANFAGTCTSDNKGLLLLLPLNHFHPVLLKKSNSGLRCVFRIIVMLEKCTTTKGTE